MAQWEETACQCRRCGFHPWVGKIPWRRDWLSSLVFSGKSHGQRSLAGYSPWGRKRVGHDLATKQKQKWSSQETVTGAQASIKPAHDGSSSSVLGREQKLYLVYRESSPEGLESQVLLFPEEPFYLLYPDCKGGEWDLTQKKMGDFLFQS